MGHYATNQTADAFGSNRPTFPNEPFAGLRVPLTGYMASPFTAQSKEDALRQYTQLSSSPNPNDKLLALGGLTQFISDAGESYLRQAAKVTDYKFLDRLIRNGKTTLLISRVDS